MDARMGVWVLVSSWGGRQPRLYALWHTANRSSNIGGYRQSKSNSSNITDVNNGSDAVAFIVVHEWWSFYYISY